MDVFSGYGMSGDLPDPDHRPRPRALPDADAKRPSASAPAIRSRWWTSAPWMATCSTWTATARPPARSWCAPVADQGYLQPAGLRKTCGPAATCTPATSAPIDPRGMLTVTDRLKDVIKTGGEWVSSLELETSSPSTRRSMKWRWSASRTTNGVKSAGDGRLKAGWRSGR